MKRFLLFIFGVIAMAGCARLDTASVAERGAVEQLIDAGTNSAFAYDRLATLCDTFGPRFSGTTNLEAAIDWILAQMKSDGLENVHGEEVMVPHWVRGAESAEMLLPRPHPLPMLGLGGSIGTPPGGITADVLVVKDFADLKGRAAEAAGKIVLFNVPFTTYGETVQYRGRGAIEAARVGAVACLVRSITPFSI
ncbi:MAG TPA: peptidase M28 family protein, partial [Verrucomicrobiae bacterium]|nr:peptidase M28 family protein [Verrucomicrobiae bacterium]